MNADDLRNLGDVSQGAGAALREFLAAMAKEEGGKHAETADLTIQAFVEDLRHLLGLESPPQWQRLVPHSMLMPSVVEEIEEEGAIIEAEELYGYQLRLGKATTEVFNLAFAGCRLTHFRPDHPAIAAEYTFPEGAALHPLYWEGNRTGSWIEALLYGVAQLSIDVDVPGMTSTLPGGVVITDEQIARRSFTLKDTDAMVDYLERLNWHPSRPKEH